MQYFYLNITQNCKEQVFLLNLFFLDVNRPEIEGIASDPKSENEFYLPDRTKIIDIANEVLDALCR